MSSGDPAGVTRFSKHDFKRHEWVYYENKAELIDNLKEYQRDYLRYPLRPWTVEAINHFLQLFCHLYPLETPREHHIRCIATIIFEEGL